MTGYRGAVGLLACAMLALVGCSDGTKLAFSAQPASTFAGETLAPVVVELQDGDGKPVDVPATVTLKLVGEGATLSGTLSVEAAGGKATFSDLWVGGGASGLVLEASVTAGEEEVGAASSAAFDVEALKLRFAGVREAYRADLPLDAFQVEVVSAKDERVVPVRRAITLGVGNNPTGAVLAGAEATAVDGKATFAALQVDRAGEGYTLVATARGASGTSSAFTLRHALEEREPKDKLAAGAQLNDTPETAERLVVGLPVFGDLSPGATVAGGEPQNDVDHYRFSAHAGELLEVATYATRFDQAHWKHGVRLTLVAVDGMKELFRAGDVDMSPGDFDFGMKQVRIPADGDYLLVLQPDAGDELDGGRYAAWVQLGAAPALLQLEAEQAEEGGGNDTLATAEPLAPGMLYGYYEGLSTPAEGDYYKLEVGGPTRVRLALTAHRNGRYLPAERAGYYDPELELYDADGHLLYGNDDTFFYDSSIEQLLPTAGTYYVRVTRCCNTGAAPYFLSYSAQAVQASAQPETNTAPEQAMALSYGQYVSGELASIEEARWFKFSGKAGDMVELFPFDRGLSPASTADLHAELYAAGDLVTRLSFESLGAADVYRSILVKDGEYYVRLTANPVGSFTFLLQRFSGAAFESETVASSAFDAQGWAAGVISAPEDVDRFTVPADAGQLVSVSLYAGWSDMGDSYSSWGSSLSPVLQLVDAQGTVLATASASAADGETPLGYAESLNRSGSTLELSFRAPARGDYFLVVSDDGTGGVVVPTVSGRVSAMGVSTMGVSTMGVSTMGVVAPLPYDGSRYYALQLWKNQ